MAIRSRIARVGGLSRLTGPLYAVGTVVFAALTFGFDKFGLWGKLLAVVFLAGLVAWFAIPDELWERITRSPEEQARRDAVDAFTAFLADSDAMKVRWLTDLPKPEVMEKELDEWGKRATELVTAHAPDHLADWKLRRTVVAPHWWRYRDIEDQPRFFGPRRGKVLARFDERCERLRVILLQRRIV